MSFLVLDGLSKSYGDTHALIDMHLAVERGEFISMLGPSGCGKTTTLQALARFVQATRGRIVLDGRDITHLPPKQRGLGMVIEPPVLLLDEPLSNLDAQLREAMQFELRRIQRKLGITTIMVTHDQAEALSINDRVVVMQAGRVQQVDAPHRLCEHPNNRFISGFVGKANLLRGRVRGAGVALANGLVLPLAASVGAAPADGAEVTLYLRPEKLGFASDPSTGRLAARIEERFFLGSQWLYRVSGTLGELEVRCPNNNQAPWPEHADVQLTWADDVARLLPAEVGVA